MIASATGQLSTKATGLDFEETPSLSVIVTATDSSLESASIAVTVVVINVDEKPAIEGNATPTYAENGTRPVATYTASDPEGETIDVGCRQEPMPKFFSIENGVLSFKDVAETSKTKESYSVDVTATDGTTDALFRRW